MIRLTTPTLALAVGMLFAAVPGQAKPIFQSDWRDSDLQPTQRHASIPEATPAGLPANIRDLIEDNAWRERDALISFQRAVTDSPYLLAVQMFHPWQPWALQLALDSRNPRS
jgi:hypothetical protein